jgi:5'-methylthioadenosine phosphorylase
MDEGADIGIIGGSGVYDVSMLKDPVEIEVQTAYGKPSDKITIGSYGEIKVAFMPRFGKKHSIPPHMVPYRANIWAMKELGVKRLIVPTAGGSLRPEIKPGFIAVPDQSFDFTKKRDYTFYDGPDVMHVSLADPFCPELSKLAVETAKKEKILVHEGGTHVTIEGPRFSTRAESLFFKDGLRASTINMTVVPECNLAREAEICYVPLVMVTDYDVWGNFPVTMEKIIETAGFTVKNAKIMIEKMLSEIPKERNACKCGEAMAHAKV